METQGNSTSPSSSAETPIRAHYTQSSMENFEPAEVEVVHLTEGVSDRREIGEHIAAVALTGSVVSDSNILQPSISLINPLSVPSHDPVQLTDSVNGVSSSSTEQAQGQNELNTLETPIESSSVRSRVQSTLDNFRPPPVLPNLALQALEYLKEKEKQTVVGEEDEFRPTKKRRIQDNETEDEGQHCSICFEPWSNSGGHRIVSLKCGHIFGQKCIEKWLLENSKCPQCNSKSKRSDLRVIYVKSISVVDTTERDRALLELEAEKKTRMLAQKAEAQAVLQYQLARAECDRLKLEIQQLQEQLECFSSGAHEGSVASRAIHSKGRLGQYELFKTIVISQAGMCRVMAHDPSSNMMVVTKPSNNNLFPGYGLAKLSTMDLQHSEFVNVHSVSGIIRDVAFSPRGDGMVLTASMDKTAKLTSMQSNVEVQSFQTSHPVWSCTWDTDEPNYLYCGLQNGLTLMYDTRNPSSHVTELVRPGSGACPITSLAHIPLCRASDLKCSGLLMGTLSGCLFWKRENPIKFSPHHLSSLPEGACTSLSFEPTTRHCLGSFRPSRATPYSRHIVRLFQLRETAERIVCQAVDEFKGGYTHKLLSRSQLFEKPGDNGQLLATFGDEASTSAQVWDVSGARKLQQLPLAKDLALDVLSLNSTHSPALSILSDSKLYVYKWEWR